MRIIVGELKKVWNVKILLIMAALSVMYFISFMQWEIESYPRGTWMLSVDIAHHLTENYGTTLEPGDFEDFLTYEETIIREVTEFIASRQVLADAGIFDFDDYLAFRDEFGPRYLYLSDEERNRWYAVTGEFGTIIRTIDGTIIQPNPYEPSMAYNKWIDFQNVVGLYQTNILRETEWGTFIDGFIYGTPRANEREIQRAMEIRDSGELTNILPFFTMSHTWRYARSLAVFVILATLILVSPLVVTDRANKVNWLQYSSKQGRRIIKKQFVAALISAILMTTILVLVFAGVYGAATGVHAFWNTGINSFLNGQFYWLSITFGQYCLLMIGLLYLLSIGAAAFAFVLSRFSQNRIKLLFKVVPFFVAGITLSNWILHNFLAIFEGGNFVLQLSVLAVSVFAGMVTAMVVVRSEQRVEL